MNLPELHLWERAALGFSERRSSEPRGARRGAARKQDTSAQDLRRARSLRARMRTATVTGLVMSAMVSVPVGWTFVQSAFLSERGAAADECPELASLLAPSLQTALRMQRGSQGLSQSATQALSTKVCGPGMQAMLRPLLEGVTDLQGLRELAKGGPSSDAEFAAMPALKSLMVRPGPQGP